MQQQHSLTLFAEIVLIYRQYVPLSEQPKITRSRDAYELFMEQWDKRTLLLFEQCKVLYLNRSNRLIGMYSHSTGGISGTVADPRIIFAGALKCAATALILAHNHPSGTLSPSHTDIALTTDMVKIGQLHNIKVADHLIVSPDSYHSFSDEGTAGCSFLKIEYRSLHQKPNDGLFY